MSCSSTPRALLGEEHGEYFPENTSSVSLHRGGTRECHDELFGSTGREGRSLLAAAFTNIPDGKIKEEDESKPWARRSTALSVSCVGVAPSKAREEHMPDLEAATGLAGSQGGHLAANPLQTQALIPSTKAAPSESLAWKLCREGIPSWEVW